MRTTVGSRQWAVVNEAPAKGRALFLPVRHSSANKASSIDAAPPSAHRPLRTEDGVILIALLWILIALSVIAMSFSRESHVEVRATRNAQSLESAYFAARAGISATIFQLIQKRAAGTQTATATDTIDPLDLGVLRGIYNGSNWEVNFWEESGKINVNTVNEQQLVTLCEAVGIGENEALIIAESILDWRDADSNPMTNGAETNDWYSTLDPPYKAKNANLDTIEELLLIRGVTPDYFFGHAERAEDGSIVYMYGLSRYLTAYSSNQQINVNFAELPALESIPGISPETALSIYERRKVQPFKNMSDLTSSISSIGTATQYMTTNSSYLYTFIASGQAQNSKAKRIIRAVVNVNASQGKQYQILYWNENVPDYYLDNTQGYTQ
jgi:general secretion pathway protein K